MSFDQFACQYTQGFFSQITVGQYFESVAGSHVSVDAGVSADIKYGIAVEGVYGGALSTNLTGSTQVGWGPKYSFNVSDETEIAESNKVYYEEKYVLNVGATAPQKLTYQKFKFSAKLAIVTQCGFWLLSAGAVQTVFGVSKKDGEVSTGDIDVSRMIGPSMGALGIAAISALTFVYLIIKMKKWSADLPPTQTLYVKKGAGCYLGSMQPAVAAVPAPAPGGQAAAGTPARLSELHVSSGTILAKCYEGVDRSLPSSNENISQGNGLPKSQLMMDGNQVQLTADDNCEVTLCQGRVANKGKIRLHGDGTAEFGSCDDRGEYLSKVDTSPRGVEASFSGNTLSIRRNVVSAVFNATTSIELRNGSITANAGGPPLMISAQAITVGAGANKIRINANGVQVTDNFKILNPNNAGDGTNIFAQIRTAQQEANEATTRAENAITALENKVTNLEKNASKISSEIQQKVDEALRLKNKEILDLTRIMT